MPQSMLALLFLYGLAQWPALGQAQGQAPTSGIYSCVDGKGRKLTSDRPIPECLDREQKVLNPSGTVRTRVGPTLTEKERAEIEAREKQQTEARAVQNEEKRRERALLVRYPTREVHDRERASAFAQVSAVAQAAQKRIDALLIDHRKLGQEMEFYKRDPGKAPASLRHQIEEIDSGVLAQRRFIGDQEQELRRVSARFDEELERLKPLWGIQAGTQVPSPSVRRAP